MYVQIYFIGSLLYNRISCVQLKIVDAKPGLLHASVKVESYHRDDRQIAIR